jgi:hypothetical protein
LAGKGAAMVLTYYDPVLGTRRVKRRYVWAMAAFLSGLVIGVIAARML